MGWIDRLSFASDAEVFALSGAAMVIAAVLFQLMDRLRERRRSVERLERVGLVPWSGLSIMVGLLGGCILMFSLPVVLANL